MYVDGYMVSTAPDYGAGGLYNQQGVSLRARTTAATYTEDLYTGEGNLDPFAIGFDAARIDAPLYRVVKVVCSTVVSRGRGAITVSDGYAVGGVTILGRIAYVTLSLPASEPVLGFPSVTPVSITLDVGAFTCWSSEAGGRILSSQTTITIVRGADYTLSTVYNDKPMWAVSLAYFGKLFPPVPVVDPADNLDDGGTTQIIPPSPTAVAPSKRWYVTNPTGSEILPGVDFVGVISEGGDSLSVTCTLKSDSVEPLKPFGVAVITQFLPNSNVECTAIDTCSASGGGGGTVILPVTAQVYGGNASPFEGKVTNVSRNGASVVSDDACKYPSTLPYIFPVDLRSFPSGIPQPKSWIAGGVDLSVLPNNWTHGSPFPSTGTDARRLPDGLGWVRLPAGVALPAKRYDYPDWGALQAVSTTQNNILGFYARVGETNVVYAVMSQPFQTWDFTKIAVNGTAATGISQIYGCVARIVVACGAITTGVVLSCAASTGMTTSTVVFGALESAAATAAATLQVVALENYGTYFGEADDLNRLKRGTGAGTDPIVIAVNWTPDEPSLIRIYWDQTIKDLSTAVAAGMFVVHSYSSGLIVTGVSHLSNRTTLVISGSINSTTESVWVSIPSAVRPFDVNDDSKNSAAVKSIAYVAKAVTCYVPAFHDFSVGTELILRKGDFVDIDATTAVSISELDDPTSYRMFYKIISVRVMGGTVPIVIVGGNIATITPQTIGVADALLYSATSPIPSDWSLLYLQESPTISHFVGSARPGSGLGVATVTGGGGWTDSFVTARDKCLWVTNRLLMRAVFNGDVGQAVLPRFVYDGSSPANRVVVWDVL